MSMGTVVTQRVPRLARAGRSVATSWRNIGDQTRFYGQTMGSLTSAFTRYKAELARQIAMMSLGTGALALVGGTIAVVTFLNLSTGALVAVEGYNQFSQIGVEALLGFASAFVNTRLVTPSVAVVAMAATIGAGTTAQLGAMRINEEIDALEVMGIRAIAYLASTRVASGVIVVVPLYCVSLLLGYFAARFGTTVFFGQSGGGYDHYFRTFLVPGDVFRSFVVALAMAIVIMLIHSYYGFTARGGPAGVGEAVGRATRASLISGILVILFVTLALYGQTGKFNYSG